MDTGSHKVDQKVVESAYEGPYFGVRYGSVDGRWGKYSLARLAEPHVRFWNVLGQRLKTKVLYPLVSMKSISIEEEFADNGHIAKPDNQ